MMSNASGPSLHNRVLLPLVLACAFATAFGGWRVREHLHGRLLETATARAHALANSACVLVDRSAADGDELQRLVQIAAAERDVLGVRIVDERGVVLASSRGLERGRAKTEVAAAAAPAASVEKPVRIAERNASLELILDTASCASLADAVALRIGAFAALACCAVLLLGRTLLVRTYLRPLGVLRGGAVEVARTLAAQRERTTAA